MKDEINQLHIDILGFTNWKGLELDIFLPKDHTVYYSGHKEEMALHS